MAKEKDKKELKEESLNNEKVKEETETKEENLEESKQEDISDSKLEDKDKEEVKEESQEEERKEENIDALQQETEEAKESEVPKENVEEEQQNQQPQLGKDDVVIKKTELEKINETMLNLVAKIEFLETKLTEVTEKPQIENVGSTLGQVTKNTSDEDYYKSLFND